MGGLWQLNSILSNVWNKNKTGKGFQMNGNRTGIKPKQISFLRSLAQCMRLVVYYLQCCAIFRTEWKIHFKFALDSAVEFEYKKGKFKWNDNW